MPELREIPLHLVDASPDQNRTTFDPIALQGLAESIQESGVLQPIVVRDTGVRYVLVAGERRTRAARLAGLTMIPAMISTADDAQVLVDTLVENECREATDPIEQAIGYARAIESCAVTSCEELARKLGIRATRVRSRIALLELNDDVQHLVRSGALKLTYAAAMLGLDANRQVLAIHAYNVVPTPGIDAFRLLCERMRDDQAAEGMSLLDAGAFLRVDEWVRELAPVVEDSGPVGVREIGAALGVSAGTVHKYRQRHKDFPAPTGSVSGTPYWALGPVLAWARSTGRLGATETL